MIGVGLASLIISSLLAITSIYGIIFFGATVLREAGQGRNPAALSEVNCVLFSIALDESSPRDEDELRYIDAVRAKRELRSDK